MKEIIIDNDLVANNYLKGKTLKEIAYIFNVSKTKIYLLLKRNKIEMRKRGYKKGHIAWNKGKTSWNKGLYGHPSLKHIKEWKEYMSKIEIKIQNFLKKLGIDFFIHQYIKEIKHGYQCDILIPSMNLVIECDGDYWHKYPIGLEKDYIRTKELIEKGFKVLRLWECEINSMDLNKFRNRLGI